MTVRSIVAKAKRHGILVPQPCEECGDEKENDPRLIVAHHDDYAKPLDVRWLCRMHHHWWHQDNTALNTHLKDAS